MSKDKITVSMNVHDIPIVVEALEEANKETERLHSIIKEVREKIESVQMLGLRSGKTLIATLLNDILEILDKENNNEDN